MSPDSGPGLVGRWHPSRRESNRASSWLGIQTSPASGRPSHGDDGHGDVLALLGFAGHGSESDSESDRLGLMRRGVTVHDKILRHFPTSH